jgi:L-rhamnose mutarotase
MDLKVRVMDDETSPLRNHRSPLLKTFAQALDLVDDPAAISAYEEYHRAVWPEVLAALREIGIERMEIFRVGTRMFMYFSAPDDFDPERDFQTYTESARCQEWDELMRQYQQRIPNATEGEWWTPMPCVFDTEWFE